MSYLGLVRPLVNIKFNGILRDSSGLSVLEIGIEKGYSSFGIVQGLIETSTAFGYVGVDIKLDHEVGETLAGFSGVNYFEQRPGCAPAIFRESENCEKSVFMYEENSLDFLERNKGKCTFDIIIVDGDHNYYTVLKELNLLMNYTTENTIILCDDYYGKYAENDLYYSDRKEYDSVKSATRIEKSSRTEKKGVKTAVDEFVKNKDSKYRLEGFSNTSWCLLCPSHLSLDLYSPTGTARDDILVITQKQKTFINSPFI